MSGRLTQRQAVEQYGCKRGSLKVKVSRALKAGRHIKAGPSARGGSGPSNVLDMHGEPVAVTGNGRVAVKPKSLDETSKRLIRAAVERNLQIAAYADLEVDGKVSMHALSEADPNRAKAAALVVGILTDKCPGILGIDKDLDGAGDLPDLTTAQGIAEAEAMFEQLPAEIKRALIKTA